MFILGDLSCVRFGRVIPIFPTHSAIQMDSKQLETLMSLNNFYSTCHKMFLFHHKLIPKLLMHPYVSCGSVNKTINYFRHRKI